MKKQILLLCLALTSLCSYAQTITVKGVVTSASDKEPMIGATVQVKGTGTGTITSIDGDYSLNDVAKDAVLVFSSIGYETQEIKVNGQTVINVVLKDASELLDEVVVIGYGAVKKSDLTSSISTVKGKEITETVTGNAMDALQGKINGVQVTSGGGPGAQPKVLIRGVTTVNGTDPLYVVDGMPVGTNINFLNSNDIESMEVLKDASAAAIYGTRASNGVILITTKKEWQEKQISVLMHLQVSKHCQNPKWLMPPNIKKYSIPDTQMTEELLFGMIQALLPIPEEQTGGTK